MARNMMAYPELRHPFEPTPLHPEGARTVLYQGRRIQLDHVGPGSGLLVSPADLTRLNGFEVKPQGACFEELCIPLNDTVLKQQADATWIDLEAFANLLEQPFVADREAGVWSFGEIPHKRSRTLDNAQAPELEVTDRAGQVWRLADLKGKKALIVTWSSW
jgi:hypothetical protein